MCSNKQAYIIGTKVYTKTINQVHLAAWCIGNLDSLEASTIVSKVIGLKYGTQDEVALPIIAECRQRLSELGYVPLEDSKTT